MKKSARIAIVGLCVCAAYGFGVSLWAQSQMDGVAPAAAPAVKPQ